MRKLSRCRAAGPVACGGCFVNDRCKFARRAGSDAAEDEDLQLHWSRSNSGLVRERSEERRQAASPRVGAYVGTCWRAVSLPSSLRALGRQKELWTSPKSAQPGIAAKVYMGYESSAWHTYGIRGDGK